MPRITPISWKRLECILLKFGFHFSRQEGGHRIYTKEGVIRHLVVPAHSKHLSMGVIMSNMRSAGLDRDTYFHYLAMC